jgi:4-amino-4-deoxy-L-arabinose transferase-like glycosyltransferase
MKSKILVLHLAVILLFSYLSLFHGLGSYSLKEPDEGRYAEIPREMVESGNYVIPHLNYCRYFEKPPLLYWVVALSYQTFGISEWSFRLPNALAAFSSVLAIYLFGRWCFGPGTAFLASLILLSSIGFFCMARIVTTDMLLTLWLIVSVCCFYVYYRDRRSVFLYAFYASLALATLTKGPIAILLIALTVFVFLLLERRISFLTEMKWSVGVPLFLIIAAPWYIVISMREKEFFKFFFVDQHILRFMTPKHNRTGPFYYFVPILLGGLFPWSALLPSAIAQLWRDARVRLILIWSGVVFGLFSISHSKLPPYILPIFPALSLVIGYSAYRAWNKKTLGWAERAAFVCMLFILSAAGILFVTDLGYGYAVHLAGPELSDQLILLEPFVIVISFAALALLVLFVVSRRPSLLFTGLLCFQAFLLTGALFNLDLVDQVRTTKELALIVRQLEMPEDVVASYSSFDESLPFYVGHRTYTASHFGELAMGSQYSDARPFFLTNRQFVELFNSSKRVFCVIKANRLERLQRSKIVWKELGRQDDKRLIVNHY